MLDATCTHSAAHNPTPIRDPRVPACGAQEEGTVAMALREPVSSDAVLAQLLTSPMQVAASFNSAPTFGIALFIFFNFVTKPWWSFGGALAVPWCHQGTTPSLGPK